MKNKKTVQKIYDANYQFPQPPDKPTLVAVPGDHEVTLYWDRKAESSIDPVLRIKDFEGYKIYRSTDPNLPKAEWTLLTPELLKTNTFQDTKVESGKTYYYYLTATDKYGNVSEPSSTASETVP